MEITYFDKDVPTVFNELAALLLQYVAGIALLVLVCAGVYYMYAGSGNSEAQAKAKRIISYCIIGLLIAVLSYSMIKVAKEIGVN
jgi:succinate dehydrogenase hydrophobic anchor subunit